MWLTEQYLVWHVAAWERTSYSMDATLLPDRLARELERPLPVAATWPADARCRVKHGDPARPVVEDCVGNTDRLLVVSDRLKDALEAEQLRHAEFLPVAFEDDHERRLAARFFILHLLDDPHCLDLEASSATLGRGGDDKVVRLERLVLGSDPDRDLCRPAGYRDVLIVRWTLAAALSQRGFSGVHWVPLFDHPTIDESERDGEIANRAAALDRELRARGTPLVLPALV